MSYRTNDPISGAVGGTEQSTTINLTGNASITGALPIANIAAGTSAQVLLNNATPAPTWTTITGDVSLTNAGATSVVSITGAAGVVNVASTGNVITWAAATTAPGITQLSETTDVATNNLTITSQAPWASAVTNIKPGNIVLNLPAPVGAGAFGFLQVQQAGVPALQLGNLVGQVAGAYGAIYPGNVTPSGSNFAFWAKNDGTLTTINASGTITFTTSNTARANIASGGIYPGADNTYYSGVAGNAWSNVGTYLLTFPTAATPVIKQADNTTNSATAANLTIQAQNATGTTATGGDLVLYAGTGTSAPGYIDFGNAGNTTLRTGVLAGNPTFGAFYNTSSTPPSASNYMMYWSEAGTIGPTTLNIQGATMGFHGNGTLYATFQNTALQFAQPLFGTSSPLQFGQSTFSIAANVTLSAGQQQTPVIALTGTVLSGGCTITLPNKLGAFWMFDITGCTFTTDGITWTTGSGTSPALTGTVLSGLQTAKTSLITVVVSASNVVSLGT